jgi:UDP-N-acetylenolpyruvoylglucosamine reductase
MNKEDGWSGDNRLNQNGSMSDTYSHLCKYIAHVEQNAPSERLHTVPVGGRMAYYAEVYDSVELVQAVKAAGDMALPYVVIGQGSSVVFPDDGYPGLVVRNSSKNMAFSKEHSQMVAESGVSLQSVIVQAAQQGLGGLVHLYGVGGSLGGALFYNVQVGGQPISDSLRSLTVLMPATRLKPEPSIVRFKGSWLLSRAEPGLTRLQTLVLRTPTEPQPVILTAQLQLTSLRLDEIARRIQTESHRYQAMQPPFPTFGPLFADTSTISAAELLTVGEAHRVRHPGLSMHKSFPNYLRVRGRYLREHNGTVPISELQEYCARIQEAVAAKTLEALTPAFHVIPS